METWIAALSVVTLNNQRLPPRLSPVMRKLGLILYAGVLKGAGIDAIAKVCDEGMTEVFDPPYEAGSRMG